jgi:hypothetical protein
MSNSKNNDCPIEYMDKMYIHFIIFQYPVAFEVTHFYSRPSLMQLCSFGLCDLDVQFTGSVNVFQMLPIMLSKIH